MDEQLTKEVWHRLGAGEALTALGLPMVDGRIDLRGLVAPEPRTLREYSTPLVHVRELDDVLEIHDVRWEGIDFSQSRLASVRIFHSSIANCRFDAAVCQNWRMWGTTVADTTFCRADLRGIGVGGIDRGQRNRFHRVDFTRADLRGSFHGAAEFLDCTFADTKLKNVDFDGDSFVACRFSGVLEEVTFNRTGLAGSQVPPNEMKEVDFRNAKLRWCEFRELDLDSVRWPADDEHIVVNDIQNVLDRYLSALGERLDDTSRQLTATFETQRRWLGKGQVVGVVNKRELLEMGGDAAVAEFLRFVSPSN